MKENSLNCITLLLQELRSKKKCLNSKYTVVKKTPLTCSLFNYLNQKSLFNYILRCFQCFRYGNPLYLRQKYQNVFQRCLKWSLPSLLFIYDSFFKNNTSFGNLALSHVLKCYLRKRIQKYFDKEPNITDKMIIKFIPLTKILFPLLYNFALIEIHSTYQSSFSITV